MLKSLVYLLSIVVLALGLYAYEVRQENNNLERTLQAQYTNSLTNASEELTSIHQSVSKSLLFNDEKALNKELENIWRVSNEFRSSISTLPLEREVTNEWLRYVGKIGDEAKNASENGDYDQWHEKMQVVEKNLQAISDEWHVAISNFYQNDVDLSQWKNIALKEQDESPFKNVSANLKSYGETDFPLTASESDWKKKQELKNLKDKKITKEEAIERFETLIPSIKDAKFTVSKSSDQAMYPFYHIQFVKGDRTGYADITEKGGHMLSFLAERPVEKKKSVSQQEIRERIDKLLKRAGYNDLKLVEMRENHMAWHVSLARVVGVGKEEALVYPDGVQLKVSKDSGDLLGFNAMEYVQKENVDEKQKVVPINWKKFFREGTVVEDEQIIYTENDGFQLRKCYQVIARFDSDLNETFRVVVDTENHDVLKVEHLR